PKAMEDQAMASRKKASKAATQNEPPVEHVFLISIADVDAIADQISGTGAFCGRRTRPAVGRIGFKTLKPATTSCSGLQNAVARNPLPNHRHFRGTAINRIEKSRTSPEHKRAPERTNTEGACAITGMSPRQLLLAVRAGDGPRLGAAKMRGLYTFSIDKLRAYVADKEAQSCPNQLADVRPRATPTGAATRSGVASGSRASTTAGRYTRAMSKLLQPGSRRT